MTTNRDTLVEQLQILSGGAMVMSTAQLAKCLNTNPKVISRHRLEGKFPIKSVSIGAKFVYPLGAIADFLSGSEPEPGTISQAKPKKIQPDKRRAVSSHSPVPDFSRTMLTRALISNFENQIKRMEELVVYLNSKMLFDNLEMSLHEHDDRRTSKKGLKI